MHRIRSRFPWARAFSNAVAVGAFTLSRFSSGETSASICSASSTSWPRMPLIAPTPFRLLVDGTLAVEQIGDSVLDLLLGEGLREAEARHIRARPHGLRIVYLGI